MTAAAALVGELEARIGLSRGTPTLLLIIVRDDQSLTETARHLSVLFGRNSLNLYQIDGAASKEGPARWAEVSRGATADAFLVAVAPVGPLAARGAAKLFNAQRQNLRDLAGPLILLLSNKDEAQIRETAPDFFSWVAQSYEAPSLEALITLVVERGAVEPVSDKPAEVPVRFLHLSDLHLRPALGKQYDQGRVLRGLISLLSRDCSDFPLDLIFITGDLAFAGVAEEYAVVEQFLSDLLQATDVPPERVFVVPGNHDIDRKTSKWLLRTLASDEEATDFFINGASRTWHAHKFDAYRTSMSKAVGANRTLGLGVGPDAVEIVEVRGQRIAVASFNSAWFAHDDADTGKLWLGEANVDQAVDRIQQENNVSLAVALMHHPTETLSEVEREPVERLLERSFDVVLRGHLHREKTRVLQGQRGSYLEIAAPASYQGSQWPNGCFLGELYPTGRRVQLRPYTFSSGTDPWVLDAKVFPDDEKHGYRHTFHLGERQTRSLGLRAAIKKGVDATLAAASPEELRAAAVAVGSPSNQRSAQMNPSALSTQRAENIVRLADQVDLYTALNQRVDSAIHHSLTGSVAEQLLTIIPQPKEPLSAGDPDLLEKGVRGFSEYWAQNKALWYRELDAKEHTVVVALQAYLLRMTERSTSGRVEVESEMSFRSTRSNSTFRVDIAIRINGRLDAIIEVKNGRSGRSVGYRALQQLDRYLVELDVLLGAALIYDAIPEKPAISRVVTPSGRPALLVFV